jgi:phage major head subunit gpT-like protein
MAVSGNWGDVLDPRFKKIFTEEYRQVPDMVGFFYDMEGRGPTTADLRLSAAGTFGDVPEFSGTVTYDEPSQGYDVVITPKEYATGFQVERKLFDDDLFGVMESRPRELATAFARTRQKHAASVFNNAFSVDTTWLAHSEGVAMCSDSHTTTAAGVSTSSGFDNKITSALSAVSLAAARIQMLGFRGDRGERINVTPSMLLVPVNLYQTAHEITQSAGVPDSANNNSNVHKGQYDWKEWIYLTDSNDWFLIDQSEMKKNLVWYNRVPYEFAQVEDFDTLTAKWRLYARHGLGWRNWRFILGASVS